VDKKEEIEKEWMSGELMLRPRLRSVFFGTDYFEPHKNIEEIIS
jgi:hypothetical protein